MAGRNRCGFVLTKGEHKGKKCNLGAGHDQVSEKNPTATAHRYTPPVARPALNLTAIGANITKVTDPRVMAEHRRTKETTADRSQERKFVDQIVQAAYDAWVESGKPTDWARSFGLQLEVPADQVVTFKDRVHTSARALAYKAHFGDDKDVGNGNTRLTLRVIDLPPVEQTANGAQQESESAQPAESASA